MQIQCASFVTRNFGSLNVSYLLCTHFFVHLIDGVKSADQTNLSFCRKFVALTSWLWAIMTVNGHTSQLSMASWFSDTTPKSYYLMKPKVLIYKISMQ